MRDLLSTNLAEVGTDCISRQQAIDAIKREKVEVFHELYDEAWNDALNGCIDVIEQLPTIQPELHWIPVEQALPEKEGKYLCTRTATWCVDGKATKVTDIAILDYSDNIYNIWEDDGEIFQNGFAFGEMWQGKLDNVQKVSAWMPLPEPYKGVVTT